MMEAAVSKCNRIKNTCNYNKNVTISHMNNLVLLVLLKTFGFFISHLFHAPRCMNRTEGSCSWSVHMFSFATDVTVWPPELMQRCVMAPHHLLLLPLLHLSPQHLHTRRDVRSHSAAKSQKTSLPYDGEGALSVCACGPSRQAVSGPQNGSGGLPGPGGRMG